MISPAHAAAPAHPPRPPALAGHRALPGERSVYKRTSTLDPFGYGHLLQASGITRGSSPKVTFRLPIAGRAAARRRADPGTPRTTAAATSPTPARAARGSCSDLPQRAPARSGAWPMRPASARPVALETERRFSDRDLGRLPCGPSSPCRDPPRTARRMLIRRRSPSRSPGGTTQGGARVSRAHGPHRRAARRAARRTTTDRPPGSRRTPLVWDAQRDCEPGARPRMMARPEHQPASHRPPRPPALRLSVIGASSWGNACPGPRDSGAEVVLWAPPGDRARDPRGHRNSAYLPDLLLPSRSAPPPPRREALEGRRRGDRDPASRCGTLAAWPALLTPGYR